LLTIVFDHTKFYRLNGFARPARYIVRFLVLSFFASGSPALAIQDNASQTHYITGGSVGIGTTSPQSLLHVNAGEVQVGSSGATCSGTNAGAIRYSSGNMTYCNGSAWTPFEQPLCSTGSTAACWLSATRSSGDANFTAANIKSGTSILGVTGTYSGSGGTACTKIIYTSTTTLAPNVGQVIYYTLVGAGGGGSDSTNGSGGSTLTGSWTASGSAVKVYVGGGGGAGGADYKTSGGGGGAGYYGGGGGGEATDGAQSSTQFLGGGGGGSTAILDNATVVAVANGGAGGVSSYSGGAGGGGSTTGGTAGTGSVANGHAGSLHTGGSDGEGHGGGAYGSGGGVSYGNWGANGATSGLGGTVGIPGIAILTYSASSCYM